MKKLFIITILTLLSVFTVRGLLAQEEYTDADVQYTTLTLYEDAIINSMTWHYEWNDGDTAGTTVTMSASVR